MQLLSTIHRQNTSTCDGEILGYRSAMQRDQWISSRLKPRVAATLAVLFVAALTVVAFVTPVQVQFYIAFAFPIFLCAWTRSRAFLWGLTIFCILVVLVRVIAGWPPPA